MNSTNKFAKELKNEKIFKIFNGTRLFSALIFLIFNFNIFTFEEMIILIFIVIVLFKSITNIMIYFIISLKKLEYNSKVEYYEEIINKEEKH